MAVNRDIRVLCPFYQKEESKPADNWVVCEGLIREDKLVLSYRFKEGLVEEGKMVMKYRFKKDVRTQFEAFCCKHFERCEVYRVLMALREDDVSEDGVCAE